jgi:hypothetical protein
MRLLPEHDIMGMVCSPAVRDLQPCVDALLPDLPRSSRRRTTWPMPMSECSTTNGGGSVQIAAVACGNVDHLL